VRNQELHEFVGSMIREIIERRLEDRRSVYLEQRLARGITFFDEPKVQLPDAQLACDEGGTEHIVVCQCQTRTSCCVLSLGVPSFDTGHPKSERRLIMLATGATMEANPATDIVTPSDVQVPPPIGE
jgi:hypothetical protein